MTENTNLERAALLLDLLKRHQLSIAFAESITGGLLAATLTRIPGASSALLGSLVCYNRESKIRLLEVPEKLLLEKGAESEEVTRAMAEGLSGKFPEASLLLAITGAASAPVNEYQISSSPGQVFICFGQPGSALISRQEKLSGTREEVLEKAVSFAFDCLIDLIRKET